MKPLGFSPKFYTIQSQVNESMTDTIVKERLDTASARAIIERYKGEEGVLIKILQEIQGAYSFVPEEVVDLLCQEMDLTPIRIYGILTFYGQFRLEPPGRHTLRVCQGTACHVMGAQRILEYIEKRLGISPGYTTEDNLFSLERVACMGCCGMAPVVVIDNEIRGHQTIKDVEALIVEVRHHEEDGGSKDVHDTRSVTA